MLPPLLRWAGRLTSVVILAFIVLSATEPAGRPTTSQLVALLFFPVIVGVGLVLAWWREDVGAVVATVGLFGFYVWSFASGGHFARGPWFIVCWSPTLLFAASWSFDRWGHRRKMSHP